jgi:hypothetical protein
MAQNSSKSSHLFPVTISITPYLPNKALPSPCVSRKLYTPAVMGVGRLCRVVEHLGDYLGAVEKLLADLAGKDWDGRQTVGLCEEGVSSVWGQV